MVKQLKGIAKTCRLKTMSLLSQKLVPNHIVLFRKWSRNYMKLTDKNEALLFVLVGGSISQ